MPIMALLEETEYYSISYLLAKIIELLSMSGTKLELCVHYLI